MSKRRNWGTGQGKDNSKIAVARPRAEPGLHKFQLSSLSAFHFKTPSSGRLIRFPGKVQHARLVRSRQSFKSPAFAVVGGGGFCQRLKSLFAKQPVGHNGFGSPARCCWRVGSCIPPGVRGALLARNHRNTARDQAPVRSAKQTDNNHRINTASLEQIKQGIYLNWELKEAIKTFPLVFLFCLLMRPGSCPSDSQWVHIWRTRRSLAYLRSGKF